MVLKRKLAFLLECLLDFPWRRESYSQFGEDLLFLSLMEHYRFRRRQQSEVDSGSLSCSGRGFYVDVGAFRPKRHSNTYLLYKDNWRGLNIDATPGAMKLFNLVRRRDINIEAAVSDTREELTYYWWEGGAGVANTFSKQQAERFTTIYAKEPNQKRITTVTLEELLDTHLRENQTIDLISIDVEGHNLKVLRSNNWERYAPDFVIVEMDNGENTIEQIQRSEIYAFLHDKAYILKGWTCLSLLFQKG